jgi:hypothetical protein
MKFPLIMQRLNSLQIDTICALLAQEEIKDIVTIDLHACGRQDLGVVSILGTTKTTHHGRRVSRLLTKTIRALEIPHLNRTEVIRSFGQRDDEWVGDN